MKSEVIASNLQEDLWDLDTVSCVVEAKKQARNVKGSTMNLFVLKTDHDRNDSELQTFIQHLKTNIKSIPDGTRIQLAVQAGEHWYPIDIQVNNDTVSAIIPEAGISPSTVTAAVLIMRQFPDASLYRFYPDTLSIDGKERTLMIQSDGESCSRFALQQLFSLQKQSTIHQKLQQYQSNLKKEDLDPESPNPYPHYSLRFSNCPPEIAIIFKSTQSLTALNTLEPEVKSAIVNEKGESLSQFNERFTRADPNANNRPVNLGIMEFKKKHADETIGYLKDKKEDKLNQALDLNTRGGIDFLTKGENFRQGYIKKQEDKFEKKAVGQKSARNDVWQQVNDLCRTEIASLQSLSKGIGDNRNETINNYIKQLEVIRVEFMGTKPKNNQTLSSTYSHNIGELTKITSAITSYLEQEGGIYSTQDLKTIENKSQKLNTMINPPSSPNKLEDAFSAFKSKFKAITSNKGEQRPEVDAQKSSNLTMK